MYVLSVVREQQKAIDEWSVFHSLSSTSVFNWFLRINVYYWDDGLCVIWIQNTILRSHNIVLNVKFHWQENWGVLPVVCVFCFFLNVVLRELGMVSENVLRKTVIYIISFKLLLYCFCFNQVTVASNREFSYVSERNTYLSIKSWQ